MSEPRRTAFATVEVVLEIETDTWGPECTMGQITKQAKDAALGKLRVGITLDPCGEDRKRGVRLVSTGKVRIRCEETPT